MNATLLTIASDIDGFDHGPTSDWLKANESLVRQFVESALYRAFNTFEQFPGTIGSFDTGQDGVAASCKRDYYAKCCHVGSDTFRVKLTWDELVSGASHLADKQWDDQLAAQNLAEEEKSRRQREASERNQLAALKAKYPTP